MQTFPDIHLYHSPGTRSERVKKLLELLDFPHAITFVDQSADAHKTDSYLKVNPFGKLPGMTVDGVSVVESAAQMLLIADLDPEHRYAPPTDHPMRKHYLQWMVAMPASLEPLVMPMFNRAPSPNAHKCAKQAIAIQTSMFKGPYCAGGSLTAADVLVHWGLRFVAQMDLLEDAPLWLDYVERLNAELDWVS